MLWGVGVLHILPLPACFIGIKTTHMALIPQCRFQGSTSNLLEENFYEMPALEFTSISIHGSQAH